MDRELSRLIALAESGAQTPRVQVMTSSALVVGQIASAREFWSKTRDPSDGELARGARFRKLMTTDIGASNKGALRASLADQAALGDDWQASLKALEAAASEAQPDALTIVGATVSVANERLNLPVVRIPMTAVNAWWVVSGAVSSGGGGWMVGATIST